jgi:Kef-type K+ transport system membrane component KefB
MNYLLLIGIIILAGYLGKKLSNWIKLPGVTGYLIIGVLLGCSVFNLLKPEFLEGTGFFTDITLGVVGFIIGSQLAFRTFRQIGRRIFTMLFTESFGAFILVFLAILLFTRRAELALLIAAIAPATAPAGTVAVLQEYRAKGILTNSLLAIVGLDDGVCIMIYVFASAIAKVLVFSSEAVSVLQVVLVPLYRITLSMIIGGVGGLILSLILRKIHTREETMVLIFGFIFLFTGIANFLNVSLILANMAMGIAIANLYPVSTRRISRILDDTTPLIYIVFFVLAGAHLNVRLLPAMGIIGLLYIIARSAGKIGGATLGAFISKAPRVLKKYLGLGLFSQAGVAIGLSLLVIREFSGLGEQGRELAALIVTTIAATTVIFEIIGPITAKIAIMRAGEARTKS